MRTPLISVIVAFYRMQREASRTLYSLTTEYQRGVEPGDYEVLAVENPSDAMLNKQQVEGHGDNFRLIQMQKPALSPAEAINSAASEARGEYVMILIDGARILSPGILRFTHMAARLHPNPVVAALAWHLGPKVQQESIREGYNFETEDKLLENSRWKEDGYRLFDISSLAGSCRGGWTRPLAESNCLTIKKTTFQELGGYSRQFATPGGGFVNLDLYERAVNVKDSQLFILLGEGTFHQMHGGAASGRADNSIIDEMRAEYERIRGSRYQVAKPANEPIYLGVIPSNTKRFIDVRKNKPSPHKKQKKKVPRLVSTMQKVSAAVSVLWSRYRRAA